MKRGRSNDLIEKMQNLNIGSNASKGSSKSSSDGSSKSSGGGKSSSSDGGKSSSSGVNAATPPKKAIIYARCSTKKQNEDNLHSIASQRAACKHYGIMRGFNIINGDDDNDDFSDIMPGHNISKLSIAAIMINPDIDIIIVKDPSRISRNPAQGTKFVMDCLNAGIVIYSVSDNIDTSTTHELKQFTSFFFDALAESQQISKRIRTTFNMKKLNGGKLGKARYGQKFVQVMTDSEFPIQHLKINKTETRIIRLIILLYYGGNLDEVNNTLYKVLEKKDLTSEQRHTLSKAEKKILAYSAYNQKGIYWVDDKTDTKHSYTTDILYGYNTHAFIAQILNYFNILKKDKPWTTSGVARVINNYIDYVEPNPICLTSYGVRNLYEHSDSDSDSTASTIVANCDDEDD